jgi:8-oxo-dGTP pyrophosphatase MutT (NUDIX family)
MPGLTHAQAAALEAFEEAGVHGRMEEASFARYIHPKGGNTQRSVVTEITVAAHLCEVRRLGPPQEFDRNPTWFPADKAKKRLRDDRPPDFGFDLARVVDRAISRVRRLRIEAGMAAISPRKAQFIDIGKIRAAARTGTSRTG